MKNIKLVAFDLDYTMLRTGGILSDFALSTIKKASEYGIYMVPATGRARCEMEDILEKISPRYLISVNGAVIWDLVKEKIIYKKLPPQDKIMEQLEIALSMGIYTEAYCEKVYVDRFSYDNMEKLGMPLDQIPMFKSTRTVVSDLYGEMKRIGQVEKLHLLFKSVEDKKNRQDIFLNHPEFAYTAAFVSNLELCAKNVDKGTALMALADILGIDRNETMAIGDGQNDVPMLKWAGIGVAMENAVPETKAAADVTTSDNDSDGAAAAIRKWAFNEG